MNDRGHWLGTKAHFGLHTRTSHLGSRQGTFLASTPQFEFTKAQTVRLNRGATSFNLTTLGGIGGRKLQNLLDKVILFQ